MITYYINGAPERLHQLAGLGRPVWSEGARYEYSTHGWLGPTVFSETHVNLDDVHVAFVVPPPLVFEFECYLYRMQRSSYKELGREDVLQANFVSRALAAVFFELLEPC